MDGKLDDRRNLKWRHEEKISKISLSKSFDDIFDDNKYECDILFFTTGSFHKCVHNATSLSKNPLNQNKSTVF